MTYKLPDHPAIQEFGLYWNFWFTFLWARTNDTALVRGLLDKAKERHGHFVSIPPSEHAAHAIRAVHNACCTPDDCELDSAGSCVLWEETWRELQFLASNGKIRSLGRLQTEQTPASIPCEVWKMAERPCNPTCIELPAGLMWMDVRFDAADVISCFHVARKYKGRRPSKKALRDVIQKLIDVGANVREFPRLAKMQFEPDNQPTDRMVHEMREELGYSKPKGRPKL